MRLDKLTVKAQEALQEAKNLADRYNQQQIEAEHLLLALAEQPEGIVIPILQKIGVDVDQLKTRLDEYLRSQPQVYGAGGVDQLFISPRLNRVL